MGEITHLRICIANADANHKLYNVEIQSSGGIHYRNRALYYWSKLYTSQIKESVDYETLLPTIGINILDFILFPELPAYHNFFVITEGKKRVFPYRSSYYSFSGDSEDKRERNK